jgi:hypothetical protein
VSGLVTQILSDHNGDVVLVAGHSNTVPQTAQQLGVSISMQQFNDFDNLFVVTRSGAGNNVEVNVVNLQYGQSSPPNLAQSDHPIPSLLVIRTAEAGVAGAARAEKLAHVARKADVDVIFADPPQQTVQPLAEVLNLTANPYPPEGVQGIIIQLLTGSGQLFVVAGQKDDISETVNELSGHPLPPLFANEYDNLLLLTVYQSNEAKVLSLQYGEPSP